MSKLKLFDEDNDGDIFHLKTEEEEQKCLEEKISSLGKLSSRKTSKLIQLKSKVAHDDRFRIDERFVEDEENDGDELPNQEYAKNEIEAEKDKNLQILEQVIGKPIKKIKKHPNNQYIRPLLVPRYDPSKEECQVFLLDNKKKQERRKIDNLEKQPEQSKNGEKININEDKKPEKDHEECYYEIGTNLKDLFSGQTTEFTLSSTFQPQEEYSQTEQIEPFPLNKKKPKLNFSSNVNNGYHNDSEEKNDKIQIKLPKKSFKFGAQSNSNSSGFLMNSGDSQEANIFYSVESVKKVQENCKQRQILMMRALSLRKKSSLKNKRSEKKYLDKKIKFQRMKRSLKSKRMFSGHEVKRKYLNHKSTFKIEKVK